MKKILPLLLVAAILAASANGCGSVAPTLLPIFVEAPIDLSQEGTTAETEFHVWREDRYVLKITYDTFGASFDDNPIIQYLGGWQTASHTGARIPLHVSIVKLTYRGEETIVNKISGGGGIAALPITNTVDYYSLKAGKYRLRVTNLESHRQLKYVPVKIWMWYFRTK